MELSKLSSETTMQLNTDHEQDKLSKKLVKNAISSLIRTALPVGAGVQTIVVGNFRKFGIH